MKKRLGVRHELLRKSGQSILKHMFFHLDIRDKEKSIIFIAKSFTFHF